MDFRAMNEGERELHLKRLREAREQLSIQSQHVASLEHELVEGVWVSGPADPIVADEAREWMAKVEKGRAPEHFDRLKVGDKVRHVSSCSTGIVVRKENYATAVGSCLPSGPCVFVELDKRIGVKTFKPEYLEIIEEGAV